ncbi:hypothetical protein HYW42_00480 [Candidatus Daviesbacteria bacterium]|nr:hypothetical protein [Candidatus Daviesbacteria bacterium]
MEQYPPDESVAIASKLTTPEKRDEDFVNSVVANAKKMVPTFENHQASPITPESRVFTAEELKGMQKYEVGANAFPTAGDVLHQAESVLKPVTGKSIWYRIADAVIGINPLRKRQQQKAGQIEIDSKEAKKLDM